METNEISMYMDAKLDIHGKRPESLKFKTWTRCLVKMEAIKCLPSFLRITLKCSPVLLEDVEQAEQEVQQAQSPALAVMDEEPQLSVSINVPGVSVSQTESRTKPFSYGLFWKQHRRDCYIYFAIESETSCRRHMKWIRKSIKNLELHRQVFLEQRRNSRGPGRFVVRDSVNSESCGKVPAAVNALGPLPQIPNWRDANSSASWSGTRVSEIYEEIFDQDAQPGAPRLSRRYSRTSIASGIYEEMKPMPMLNFKAIVEEVLAVVDASPPPVPPVPPPRKRINTFETESGLLGEIPRSNTNPESDMAKKKKYKNMLDSIFGGVGRAKRAESVSESVVCSVDELLQSESPAETAVYENVSNVEELHVTPTAKRQRQKTSTKYAAAVQQMCAESKRNSFSSPDLSKINFIDTFNEDHVAAMMFNNSFAHSEELCCSESLNESSIQRIVGGVDQSGDAELPTCKTASHESINISQQIPVNFNFSACNTSSINLVGASGASLLQTAQKKNKILGEDMTGYCIMAPIAAKKISTTSDAQPAICGQLAPSTQCIQSTLSSGYSTGSCYSSSATSSAISSATPSCSNSTEHNLMPWVAGVGPTNEVVVAAEESAIYENMMCGGSLNSSTVTTALYENLLTVKAAQELVATTVNDTPTPPAKMSTSTPTGVVATIDSPAISTETDEEGFYQTPRKSIISVDEKVPSYYPNSCESNKQRRRSHSPIKATTTPNDVPTTSNASLRQLVNVKLHRERKENYYISSPQQILDQRQKAASQSQATKSKSNKLKKTAAHKISENVYCVSHAHNKKSQHNSSNNNNKNKDSTSLNNADAALQAKLQRELLQLAALQSIDFTFDDSKQTPELLIPSVVVVDVQHEEAENCFQTKASAMLHKYATMARTTPTKLASPQAVTPTSTAHHHLQQSQQANTQQLLDVSKKQETQVLATAATDGGLKKFASLPRFKKIDFSPLKLKINNVLQRNQHPQELT